MKWFSRVVLSTTLAMTFIAMGSAVSHADTLVTASGPGSSPGDWSQEWNESSSGTFDRIDVFIETAGVSFSSPGIAFGTTGWSSTDVNPAYSFATGPTSTFLDFFTDFTSAASVPLTIDFYALNNGGVVDQASLIWSGSGWSYGETKGLSSENTSPVPEPSSLLLFGSGLVGLAGIARRKLVGA